LLNLKEGNYHISSHEEEGLVFDVDDSNSNDSNDNRVVEVENRYPFVSELQRRNRIKSENLIHQKRKKSPICFLTSVYFSFSLVLKGPFGFDTFFGCLKLVTSTLSSLLLLSCSSLS
jgi:hypothetical protein